MRVYYWDAPSRLTLDNRARKLDVATASGLWDWA